MTSDHRVTGTVDGDFAGGHVEVEVDNYGNGSVKGSTDIYSPGIQIT